MCASLAVTWSLLTGRVTQFGCVSLSGGSTLQHYGDACIFPDLFRRRSSLQEPRWRASAGLPFPICRIMSPERGKARARPGRPAPPQLTPSLRCRLVDEVVYWKVSFLSGYT